MRAHCWLFNVLDTFWIVSGGAVLFLALIGALGSAWLATAILLLMGKHMAFRGNDAESLPVTLQPISIPDRHTQHTATAFSTRKGHRASLITSEVEPSNSEHTSIRV
jgi:hypothetical protein